MAQKQCIKYEGWIEPIKKIVPELKRRLSESDTGKIQMTTRELESMMGPE